VKVGERGGSGFDEREIGEIVAIVSNLKGFAFYVHKTLAW